MTVTLQKFIFSNKKNQYIYPYAFMEDFQATGEASNPPKNIQH
jgi:hypothetical protein